MGRQIVSFSGGIASAASAVVASQAGLDFELVFADTRIEDEDLYRFIDEVAAKLGKKIIRLSDGRDPWDVFRDVRYIGNTRVAHCSKVLKTDQVRKWLAENGTPEDELVLGMFLDEEDRLKRARAVWAPVPVRSLLIDYKVFPGAAAKLVEELGVKRPRLYDQGFPHNNCGGFCVRAGQGQFATLLANNPKLYAEHERRMEEVMADIGPTARPFLRVQKDRKVDYLTLRDFRERIESGELQPNLYEKGGCGCFVDDDTEVASCPLPLAA